MRFINKLFKQQPSTYPILAALVIGAILRLIWVSDMEYKEDEEYMFLRHQNVGLTEPWPWLGIPSGVYIKNPGMSVWVFLLLGKIFHVTDPTGLARAVQILNIIAIALLIPFALWLIDKANQKAWFWAMALVSVNPFAVMYHRKIWAQSVSPFFSVLFLTAWMHRNRTLGAFFWGLMGACLGQIHMSGFFFAGGFFLWALIFDRPNIRWISFVAGSLIGSITLYPWFVHLLTEPTGHPLNFGLNEAIQLKFWVFWITDPLGLHLGNALGVVNGNSTIAQLADFIRYPIILDQPTYLMAIVHILVAIIGVSIIFRGSWLLSPAGRKNIISGKDSPTSLMLSSAIFGYGCLITVATVLIHRFYLLVTFPLEFVWLARIALRDQKWGRISLIALFVMQLSISAAFLGYVHVNGGAPKGDYGVSYRLTPASTQYKPVPKY